MEFERQSGTEARGEKPRKPVRKPDESVIRTSRKPEQERPADAGAKYTGQLLTPGSGEHFERAKRYKRGETGAPQPWDAAQVAARRAQELREQREAMMEKDAPKKALPKARGCLGVLLSLAIPPLAVVAALTMQVLK